MKNIITLIVFTLLNISLHSQAITGKVLDEKNQPIEYANIFNGKKETHAHSNENGFFIIQNTSINDTLQISCLGYTTKSINILQKDSILEIRMVSKTVSLNEVVVSSRMNALNVLTDIDNQINPVNSSQDVLRQVPGLFIGQHAGGGKAEQIFLRGFDIDHGTDLSISVDDRPVNMVSHAHGQGYSDLHFVIPETIDKIDFGKGSYYADKGNFNTAGYVNFKTKERLDNSLVKVEIGQFNSKRIAGLFSLANKRNHSAYIASEYIGFDGPYDSPQNFYRINLFGKYTSNITESDKISVTTSHFTSQWDASGQIPQRAVDNNSISRFGSIDDTEGGKTSRTNLWFDYTKYIDEKSTITTNLSYSHYDFELYSNFTFFLEDSINGDQIKQKENRNILGLQTEYNRIIVKDRFNGAFQFGANIRNDMNKDVELSHTKNRDETLEQIQYGDILETNIGAYTKLTYNIGKWSFIPAVRLDFFDFQYTDKIPEEYTVKSNTKTIVSPKMNVLYNPIQNLQLYLKLGKGFHSNDTRVVLNQSGKKILPATYSGDLGFLWKPSPKVVLNAAYWYLHSEQEFVYVGDAGIVEPSGKSRRQGIDLSLMYQPLDWLYTNIDANYTHARSIEEEKGEDFIPLAPDLTLVSSINVVHPTGFYASTNLKFLKNRPANEDNSIIAKGYTVVDLNMGYEWKKKLNFGIHIQNLFNTEWNETQFATESRLEEEAAGVEEIHFTPGTPFFLKGIISYKF
ncbi:MAG: TonB-dependent receptor [Chitinophagales bacterium]